MRLNTHQSFVTATERIGRPLGGKFTNCTITRGAIRDPGLKFHV